MGLAEAQGADLLAGEPTAGDEISPALRFPQLSVEFEETYDITTPLTLVNNSRLLLRP